MQSLTPLSCLIASRWVVPQKEENDPSGSCHTVRRQPGYSQVVLRVRDVSGHILAVRRSWSIANPCRGINAYFIAGEQRKDKVL